MAYRCLRGAQVDAAIGDCRRSRSFVVDLILGQLFKAIAGRHDRAQPVHAQKINSPVSGHGRGLVLARHALFPVHVSRISIETHRDSIVSHGEQQVPPQHRAAGVGRVRIVLPGHGFLVHLSLATGFDGQQIATHPLRDEHHVVPNGRASDRAAPRDAAQKPKLLARSSDRTHRSGSHPSPAFPAVRGCCTGWASCTSRTVRLRPAWCASSSRPVCPNVCRRPPGSSAAGLSATPSSESCMQTLMHQFAVEHRAVGMSPPDAVRAELFLQIVLPELLAGKVVGRQVAVAIMGDDHLAIGHRRRTGVVVQLMKLLAAAFFGLAARIARCQLSRSQITLPSARLSLESNSRSSTWVVTKIESPQIAGVLVPHSGNSTFQARPDVFAPFKRQPLLTAGAVACRTAPLRPVFGRVQLQP